MPPTGKSEEDECDLAYTPQKVTYFEPVAPRIWDLYKKGEEFK
jgi:hypothetical protein